MNLTYRYHAEYTEQEYFALEQKTNTRYKYMDESEYLINKVSDRIFYT